MVQFAAFDTNTYDYCGITVDGGLLCWAFNVMDVDLANVPEGMYSTVSVGYGGACALALDEQDSVLGDLADVNYGSPPTDGPYVEIALGSGFACAVDNGGQA